MTIFDETWVEAANRVLAGHRTGAVPEFRVVLRLRMGGPVRQCWVVGEHGTLRFSSTPVEPADLVVTVPFDRARDAFRYGDQSRFVNELLTGGVLRIEGDFAKARFFATGLVRNATAETVDRLRALT